MRHSQRECETLSLTRIRLTTAVAKNLALSLHIQYMRSYIRFRYYTSLRQATLTVMSTIARQTAHILEGHLDRESKPSLILLNADTATKRTRHDKPGENDRAPDPRIGRPPAIGFPRPSSRAARSELRIQLEMGMSGAVPVVGQRRPRPTADAGSTVVAVAMTMMTIDEHLGMCAAWT